MTRNPCHGELLPSREDSSYRRQQVYLGSLGTTLEAYCICGISDSAEVKRRSSPHDGSADMALRRLPTFRMLSRPFRHCIAVYRPLALPDRTTGRSTSHSLVARVPSVDLVQYSRRGDARQAMRSKSSESRIRSQHFGVGASRRRSIALIDSAPGRPRTALGRGSHAAACR